MTNITKINWFPGHMKKATDKMIAKMKDVDFIIEILDARAFKLTSNKELYTIFQYKPIIQIALKNDLSDLKSYPNILTGNLKDPKFKKAIINEINNIFALKMEKFKSRGLINPLFVGMVVGIPNIGKSSFINFLCSKKTLKVQNRAGVTKSQENRRINESFFLVDTPGILFKKIDSLDDGIKLSLLNCINKEVLPMDDVLEYYYHYMVKHYQNKFLTFYNLPSSELTYEQFINFVCHKYHFKLSESENDIERCNNFLYKQFTSAKIAEMNFMKN